DWLFDRVADSVLGAHESECEYRPIGVAHRDAGLSSHSSFGDDASRDESRADVSHLGPGVRHVCGPGVDAEGISPWAGRTCGAQASAAHAGGNLGIPTRFYPKAKRISARRDEKFTLLFWKSSCPVEIYGKQLDRWFTSTQSFLRCFCGRPR